MLFSTLPARYFKYSSRYRAASSFLYPVSWRESANVRTLSNLGVADWSLNYLTTLN